MASSSDQTVPASPRRSLAARLPLQGPSKRLQLVALLFSPRASIAPNAARYLFQSLLALLPMRKRLSIAPALDKGPVDMMSGDELVDHFGDVGRHGHLFNQIVAGFGKSFALCRVCCDSYQLVWELGSRWAQNDPQRRRARCEIVAIAGRLGAMQFDCGLAGVEQGRFRLHAERRPWRSRRASAKHRNRPPQKIGPGAPGPAPLDHHTHCNARESCRSQLTASAWRMGKPAIRFCGFSRNTPSAFIASSRYNGSPRTFSITAAGSSNVSRNRLTS